MLRPDLAPIDVYLADAMLLEASEFLERHRWPMLVIAEPDWDKIAQLSRPETLIPGQGRPGVHELMDLTSAAASGASLDALCLEIRPKDPRAGLRISFGRAPEADVVLLDETISKMHAALTWDPAREEGILFDLGSRNGTFVDEVRLGRAPMELTPGGVVCFGSLVTRYYPPSSFLGWLSTGVARAGATPSIPSGR